jgi:hypothetical protein
MSKTIINFSKSLKLIFCLAKKKFNKMKKDVVELLILKRILKFFESPYIFNRKLIILKSN